MDDEIINFRYDDMMATMEKHKKGYREIKRSMKVLSYLEYLMMIMTVINSTISIFVNDHPVINMVFSGLTVFSAGSNFAINNLRQRKALEKKKKGVTIFELKRLFSDSMENGKISKDEYALMTRYSPPTP